ncbi:MAG TPA: multicopper oxidase domain-containing protein [Gemmatimonadaceae bacterium]|jgi:FtsP/CotA-like multicopper oxidase with cupredoxin domain|nr:multicopper oxidase domain-containing protein [Gemmatimonadaceae bacterium]
MRPTALSVALLLSAASMSFSAATRLPRRAALETIAPNDNRTTAGKLDGNVLTVHLEARNGTWYPEGPSGVGLDVVAWAEPGKPLQNPGPLVRVKSGTTVRASIHNTLTHPLTVFGLGASRGFRDSLVVQPGATSTTEFTAGDPGTYYYYADTHDGPGDFRSANAMQLNGAIIIDPREGARAPDRTFIISWWFALDSTSKTGVRQATMAINGLSWPHTERIDATQGDSLRWRVINLTGVDHPMHLHGFYFNLAATGDGFRDTLFSADQQRMEVTELLVPRHTMLIDWSPTRPGNWIFHCHFAVHLSEVVSLDTRSGVHNGGGESHHGTDAPHQMFGLVLGIRVAPAGAVITQATAQPRNIRLLVRSKANVYGAHPGYSFILGGTPQERDPNALQVPGPALVLERGQPVAINIINHAHEPVTIHWHGIELESYPDGVPGWSGMGANILKPVPPGDSLTVRFTPPRAGTFMYHSHFNEAAQINSGLYGPIIVLEPGRSLDPETDRVLMISSGGPTDNVIAGPFAPKLLNGQAQPDTMDLRAGTTYRFRIINISDDFPTRFGLMSGDQPATWRAVAKDGADLPASQATVRPAAFISDPGEIYDFEFTPRAVGNLAFTFGVPPFIVPNAPQSVLPIRVR